MVQKPLKSVEKKQPISLTLMGLRSVLNSRMEKTQPQPKQKSRKPADGAALPERWRGGSDSGAPGGRIGTSRGGGGVCPGPLGGEGRLAQHTLPPSARQPPSYPVSPAGHSLQRVPEDPPIQPGHVPLRRLLPKRWLGRRGPLAAAQRRDGDQAPQQYVHVSGQPRHEAHILRFQVDLGLFPNLFP